MTIIGRRPERGGGVRNDDGMVWPTDGNIDHSFGRRCCCGGLFNTQRAGAIAVLPGFRSALKK
jgi:hypothetical protein